MQVPVQEVGTTQVIVLLAAIAIVAFWRPMLRWLIVLTSTAVIATLGFGLVMIWQSTHRGAG